MGLRLITGEQIRAARALTRIDQADLARRCGVSIETIRRLERTHGQVDANLRTLSDIVEAFRELGAVFDGADGGFGVRLVAGHAFPTGSSAPRGVEMSGFAGMRTIHRLIYCSALNFPEDQSFDVRLNEISEAATVRHQARGVSGVLVVCGRRALGMLEGPRAAVFELYGRMATDPSTYEFQVVESCDVPAPRIPFPPMVCALLRDVGSHSLDCSEKICMPASLSAEEAMRIIDSARTQDLGQSARRASGSASFAARRVLAND